MTFCPFKEESVISPFPSVGSVKSGAVSPILSSDIVFNPFKFYAVSMVNRCVY